MKSAIMVVRFCLVLLGLVSVVVVKAEEMNSQRVRKTKAKCSFVNRGDCDGRTCTPSKTHKRVKRACLLRTRANVKLSKCLSTCTKTKSCTTYEFFYMGPKNSKFCALYSCSQLDPNRNWINSEASSISKWERGELVCSFPPSRAPTPRPTLALPTVRPTKSRNPTSKPTIGPTNITPIQCSKTPVGTPVGRRRRRKRRRGLNDIGLNISKQEAWQQDLFRRMATSSGRKSGASRERGVLPKSLPKPNILFILVDDFGIGDVNVHQFGARKGLNKLHTPNLARMANRGVTFTNAYSPSSVCLPSRYSLLVGKHTGHIPVRGNSGNAKDLGLGNETTVAQLLSGQSYRTGLVGKWGLGDVAQRSHPLNKGFEYFFGQLSHVDAHSMFPLRMYENRLEDREWKRNVFIPENKKATQEVCSRTASREDRGPCVFSHTLFTDKAIEFINQPDSRPFFLFLSWTAPHVGTWTSRTDYPWDKVAPYWDRECPDKLVVGDPAAGQESGLAAAECRHKSLVENYIDADVGRLLSALEKRGVGHNTVVVFAGDNGPERVGLRNQKEDVMHAVNTFGSTMGMRGIKREVFEGSTRTPLIIQWGNSRIPKPGRTSSIMTSLNDLLATFCDLAGVKLHQLPADLDSISLVPTLVKARPLLQQDKHDYLYWEYCDKQWLNHKGILENPDRFCSWAIRKGHFKFVWDHYSQKQMLFKLDKDPFEKTDLSKTAKADVTYLQCIRDRDAHISLASFDWDPRKN